MEGIPGLPAGYVHQVRYSVDPKKVALHPAPRSGVGAVQLTSRVVVQGECRQLYLGRRPVSVPLTNSGHSMGAKIA
jgi:hypothetical protein